MENTKPQNKTSIWGWAFGIIFLIVGIVELISQPIVGILLLLAAGISLPPVSKLISEKGNIHLKCLHKIVAVIVLVLIALTVSNNDSTPAQPVAVQNTQPVTALVPAVKDIPYEVVKQWTIPNGGYGKLILISPNNLNESDMLALGEKLKNDTKDDRNASISIFTDRKAIDLRDSVTGGTASPADQGFYELHFVGEYDRNINTGYHRYTIFFDGVNGKDQKEINY